MIVYAIRYEKEESMRKLKTKYKYIYLVVYVWRGFPVSVYKYNDYQSAVKKKKLIGNKINPDYDEVAIFKKRK